MIIHPKISITSGLGSLYTFFSLVSYIYARNNSFGTKKYPAHFHHKKDQLTFFSIRCFATVPFMTKQPPAPPASSEETYEKYLYNPSTTERPICEEINFILFLNRV